MSKKEAYEQKMGAQLEEWQAKVDALKAKAKGAQADKKIQYEKEIDSLNEKQEQMQHKLSELHNSSESAWENVKAGVEGAWKELRSATERAADKFK